MNGRTDGCLAPSAVSELKSSSACLQQSGRAQMGCAANVWTACKTKGCAEHALSEDPLLAEQCCVTAAGDGGALCSHDSLQIPLTDEVPNGVKVSECITLNLHPSLSLTLCFSFFYAHSLRLLIYPPSLPMKAVLSSHLTWPAFGLISQERNDILAQQRVNVKVYSAVSDLPDG